MLTRLQTWNDTLETWISLSQLRSQLSGERCKTVLNIIFRSEGVCKAVGMAYQLREIDSTVAPPDGLLRVLKQEAGVSIDSLCVPWLKLICPWVW